MTKKNKKIGIILLGISSIYLLLNVHTIRMPVLNTLTACYMYPWILFQYTCITPLQKWKEKRKTLAELTALMSTYAQKNSELLAENIALQATLVNARQVDELVNFTARYKTSYVCIAQVLLRNFSPESHFFLLDAGANRNVCPDMIVVCNNCLVGRVSDVYPYYCRVMLITDRLSKVPALCVKTGAQGIYEGMQRVDMGKLAFVSHLNTLDQGDLVISSGEGLVYPKGFALGAIENFSLDRLGLSYEVAIKPINNFEAIQHCCIIQKGAEYEAPTLSDVTNDLTRDSISLDQVILEDANIPDARVSDAHIADPRVSDVHIADVHATDAHIGDDDAEEE